MTKTTEEKIKELQDQAKQYQIWIAAYKAKMEKKLYEANKLAEEIMVIRGKIAEVKIEIGKLMGNTVEFIPVDSVNPRNL